MTSSKSSKVCPSSASKDSAEIIRAVVYGQSDCQSRCRIHFGSSLGCRRVESVDTLTALWHPKKPMFNDIESSTSKSAGTCSGTKIGYRVPIPTPTTGGETIATSGRGATRPGPASREDFILGEEEKSPDLHRAQVCSASPSVQGVGSRPFELAEVWDPTGQRTSCAMSASGKGNRALLVRRSISSMSPASSSSRIRRRRTNRDDKKSE